MPCRRVPIFVLSTGFVLMMFVVLRPLFAQAPAEPSGNAPPQFQKVQLEIFEKDPTTEGEGKLTTVEGRLKLATITVNSEMVSSTINLSRIKRITFSDTGVDDSVQLTDNSIIHGKVTEQRFTVEISGAEAQFNREQVREIKVISEARPSLVAIGLGLLTLTAMEIVLGVDNIIFLAIIAGRLPTEQQPKARKLGLAAALGTRLLLLFSISLILKLTAPLFTLPDIGFLHGMEFREVSWRDLILLAGGLFLIGKSTFEMHKKVEEAKHESSDEPKPPVKAASFAWTIVTIAIVDIVFSLDSVITAVGMVEELWVMIVAMVFAMLVMLYFAGKIADFVDRHPTIKMLALSFLILIGVMLVAEGLGQHIDKGYIYVAMAFALVVELVNMQIRKPKKAKV